MGYLIYLLKKFLKGIKNIFKAFWFWYIIVMLSLAYLSTINDFMNYVVLVIIMCFVFIFGIVLITIMIRDICPMIKGAFKKSYQNYLQQKHEKEYTHFPGKTDKKNPKPGDVKGE